MLILAYENGEVENRIIEDNGNGFPKNRDSLTNPYVTFRKKGTGLGLSIVQRIVEEHNGKLILKIDDMGLATRYIPGRTFNWESCCNMCLASRVLTL